MLAGSRWASEFTPEYSRGTTEYKATNQEELKEEGAGAGMGGRQGFKRSRL